MAVDQIGTTLDIGAGTISGSYIVQSRNEGDKDVEFEDIDDENGELKTRVVYKKHAKIELGLVCLASAEPETDFPKGQICAHTDFTLYFVSEARFSKSKSPRRADVTLTNIGVTA